ncbi:MAG: hypothetical protein Q7J54_06990 [Candidatus Woesearchaeota archaeon]|nr:hypothetical protein [Candidatus Woesearchaeota archaeon]
MATRKLLFLGRHGKAPQKPEGGSKDELFPEAITDTYKVGSSFYEMIRENGITPEKAFFRHTDTNRTNLCGKTFLVGAFNMQPREGMNPPKTQEDLANYDLSPIEISEDSRFNIVDNGVNLEVYKKEGSAGNIDYWLANPMATEHLGKPIEQYVSIYTRSREGIVDNIKKLVNDKKDLGTIVSHAVHIEIPLLVLIDSGRSTPIKKVEEIGGTFQMTEFAYLAIDTTGGGISTASLNFKNKDYKVDLNKLMNNS